MNRLRFLALRNPILLLGLSVCLQACQASVNETPDPITRQTLQSQSESGFSGALNGTDTSAKKLKVLHTDTKASSPFKVEVLAEGLGVPWGMAFLNNEELLWTERQGRIQKIHIPTGRIQPIHGTPEVYARGQGGLLDVILHPDFLSNQRIYLTYSVQGDGGQSTVLARARLVDDKLEGLERLFTAKPFVSGTRHFGSRLVFDSKGFLFMTMGDRGQPDLAQDTTTHLGKLLRLDEEGRPAPGNPFAGRRSVLPEIYSTGHRNPQGLFIHPLTKQMYVQEHGPQGGDEINLIKPGANYGWPIITYGVSYVIGFKIGEGTHKAGMEQPLKHFTPSIAPSSLLIHSGRGFPHWQGSFFSAALALRHLNRLYLEGGTLKEERLLPSLNLRFRHVVEGPKGWIYASVDEGMILKLSPIETP